MKKIFYVLCLQLLSVRTIDVYLINFVYKTTILLMLVLKSNFIIQYSPLRTKLLIIFNILNINSQIIFKNVNYSYTRG